jgi:formylglycine-generating enzyme required for sulfatase activity
METEVTQALWAEVMGRATGGAAACGPTCPVWNVQWHEAVQFANALSRRDGLEACYGWPDGQLQWLRGPACAGWRLPTEAEWEVAAGEPPPADGGEGRVSFGPGVEGRPPPTHGGAAAGDPARPPAWTEATSGGAPRPVATSAPNRHGLFDMRGNVWEWVWDGEDLGTTAGRFGPPPAIPRRARGGSWRDPDGASHLEVAQGDLPRLVNGDLGLRLVRAAP